MTTLLSLILSVQFPCCKCTAMSSHFLFSLVFYRRQENNWSSHSTSKYWLINLKVPTLRARCCSVILISAAMEKRVNTQKQGHIVLREYPVVAAPALKFISGGWLEHAKWRDFFFFFDYVHVCYHPCGLNCYWWLFLGRGVTRSMWLFEKLMTIHYRKILIVV